MSASDDIIDVLTGNEEDAHDRDGGGSIEIEDTWLAGLKDVRGTLVAFGKSPAGFIFGAVVSELLNGVQTLVESLINAILFVFLGSDGAPSATGTLGLADIPVFAATTLGSGGARVATAIATSIRTANRATVEVATVAGPLSPVLYAAILAAYLVISAWALRTAIAVAADAIPGVQGLL